MKEFAVYTLARIGLFLASLLVFFGIFAALDVHSVIWPLVLAALVSGVASYFLLRHQRERFAARVDARARAASQRFEQARAKEDE